MEPRLPSLVSIAPHTAGQDVPGSPSTVVFGVEGNWVVGYANLGPYQERGFVADFHDFPILRDSNPTPLSDTGSTALMGALALGAIHLGSRFTKNRGQGGSSPGSTCPEPI